MSDTNHKCPVDERERDQIWHEIDTMKEKLVTVEKTEVAHQAEITKLTNRIDNVQTRLFDRINHINENVDFLVKQVTQDSAELRRREGRDSANRRWGAAIVGVLGLIIGTGGFLAFKPAESATVTKPPDLVNESVVYVERTVK